MKDKIRLARWAAFALVAVAIAIAASFFPIEEWAERFDDTLERLNLLEGLLVFCAVAAVATLLFLPAWVFHLAAGGVFGMGWGLVAALAATLISAVAGFFATRRLFRKRVEKLVRRSTRFKAIEQAVSRGGWKVVAMIRLSPLGSSALKSYFFGLTRIDFGPYVGATLLGTLPGILLKVYVGAAGRDALHGGPLEWSLLAAGIIATVAVSLVVGRTARRRLKLG